MDMFHVYLLGDLCWSFLVIGRFVGLGVLVTVPWLVRPPSFVVRLEHGTSVTQE